MSDDDPEAFTLPLPPPPPGLGAERDVVFFRRHHGGPPPAEGERESEDIMLRNVPRAVAQRYRAAAGGRGMTHAQYLAALVALHESMRNRADAGDAELQAELERLGLTTVSV
ncbi:MAG: hypothetical protein ACXVZL_02390 [Gaiellaceae bacterium]